MTIHDGPALLEAWMRRNGFDQTRLSKATGVNRLSISRFLRGGGVKRLSSGAALALAGMTGIPVEKLLRDVVQIKTERSVKTSARKIA